ncbi:hypothetical protein T07_11510 [Trichinella nelsoni]|uniref:Uncharacterized protein n=1 Tax=Trichinella nelsoni TaxID=6336 RepID=A0A0V0SD98_9BILA|nr:hypothetical protein T07_11510 [Trichinella nelsoni]
MNTINHTTHEIIEILERRKKEAQANSQLQAHQVTNLPQEKPTHYHATHSPRSLTTLIIVCMPIKPLQYSENTLFK